MKGSAIGLADAERAPLVAGPVPTVTIKQHGGHLCVTGATPSSSPAPRTGR